MDLGAVVKVIGIAAMQTKVDTLRGKEIYIRFTVKMVARQRSKWLRLILHNMVLLLGIL